MNNPVHRSIGRQTCFAFWQPRI